MKIYPLFLAHQGCPHRCLFCAQEHSTPAAASLQPADLRSRLEQMLPSGRSGEGTGEIAFYGGSFTLLPDQLQADALQVAGEFIRAGRATGMRLSTRPDGLEKAVLRRLADAQVTTIEIGCQSFSQTVLDAARRGHTVAESLAAIGRCREFGFQVGIQLMPGLPGGDADEARRSLATAVAQGADFLRIYPAIVLAETGLAELWQGGQFQPWSLEFAIEVCADLLLICQRHEVPVIRLGLQQDPALSKALLAGPYHPAFGQRVRSRLWRRALAELSGRTGDVRVNPGEFSDAVGQGAENRRWLKDQLPTVELRPDPDIPRGVLHADRRFWKLAELAGRSMSHVH